MRAMEMKCIAAAKNKKQEANERRMVFRILIERVTYSQCQCGVGSNQKKKSVRSRAPS